MKFVEELRKKDHIVSTMGVRAREKARAAGVSSFYIDPFDDDVIIEEKADGVLVRHTDVETANPLLPERTTLGVSD